MRLTKNKVDVIWNLCNEDFYEEFLEFSLSGDCMVFIVKGNDAIIKFNNLVGHWDPCRAQRYTIRHQYGKSAMENVIHGTGTKEKFWNEILLFFTQSEIDQLLIN